MPSAAGSAYRWCFDRASARPAARRLRRRRSLRRARTLRRRRPFSLAVDVLVDQQARRRTAEGAEEEGGQGAVGAVRAFYLCPSSFNLRLRSMKSVVLCLRQTNLAFHPQSIPHTSSELSFREHALRVRHRVLDRHRGRDASSNHTPHRRLFLSASPQSPRRRESVNDRDASGTRAPKGTQ